MGIEPTQRFQRYLYARFSQAIQPYLRTLVRNMLPKITLRYKELTQDCLLIKQCS